MSCLSPVGQPKQQWPQVCAGLQLRGISPQCTPSFSRPAFSFWLGLLCSRIPAGHAVHELGAADACLHKHVQEEYTLSWRPITYTTGVGL